MSRPAWRTVLVIGIIALLVGAWIAFRTQANEPDFHDYNADFMVEPYLQLGSAGNLRQPHIVWAATDNTAKWAVEAELLPGQWTAAAASESQNVALPNMPAFTMYDSTLPVVPEDVAVPYRVSKNGHVVFSATTTPIKKPNKPYRVDVVGDMAANSEKQVLVAKQLYASKPEMIVVTGDVVYSHGRSREYLHHFFPIYNDEGANSVPLLRSTLMVAAPGNHDTAYGSRWASSNLSILPDGLGFFLWLHQPLNGPDVLHNGKNFARAQGPEANRKAFLQAAGNRYPKGENFSLNCGNSHWTFIDSNDYMDWTDPDLRQWLTNDLDSAKTEWKFVVFHHPPFSNARHHFRDQQLRVITDIFQDHGVDIAFGGHTHSYQRTRPLRFNAKKLNGAARLPDGQVAGEFTIDKGFDGKTNNHPQGVIYIVTAGGGASLVIPEGSTSPDMPALPFIDKFLGRFGFSQCDIDGKHLRFQQIADDGTVIDEFSIDKIKGGRKPD